MSDHAGMIGRQIDVFVKEARQYVHDTHEGTPSLGSAFETGFQSALAQMICDLGMVEWRAETNQETLRRFLDTYDVPVQEITSKTLPKDTKEYTGCSECHDYVCSCHYAWAPTYEAMRQ